MAQGGEDADTGIHSAHDICDANANLHGAAIRFTGQGHDAAVSLGHQIIAGLVGVGAGLAVSGDRPINQMRKILAQAVIVEPVFSQTTRLEVLQKNIGMGGKTADRGLAVRGGDVDFDRALVAVCGHEISGQV